MYFLIEIFLTESFVAEYICSNWLCNLGEMYNKIKYIKFFSLKNWIQIFWYFAYGENFHRIIDSQSSTGLDLILQSE